MFLKLLELVLTGSLVVDLPTGKTHGEGAVCPRYVHVLYDMSMSCTAETSSYATLLNVFFESASTGSVVVDLVAGKLMAKELSRWLQHAFAPWAAKRPTARNPKGAAEFSQRLDAAVRVLSASAA